MSLWNHWKLFLPNIRSIYVLILRLFYPVVILLKRNIYNIKVICNQVCQVISCFSNQFLTTSFKFKSNVMSNISTVLKLTRNSKVVTIKDIYCHFSKLSDQLLNIFFLIHFQTLFLSIFSSCIIFSFYCFHLILLFIPRYWFT